MDGWTMRQRSCHIMSCSLLAQWRIICTRAPRFQTKRAEKENCVGRSHPFSLIMLQPKKPPYLSSKQRYFPGYFEPSAIDHHPIRFYRRKEQRRCIAQRRRRRRRGSHEVHCRCRWGGRTLRRHGCVLACGSGHRFLRSFQKLGLCLVLDRSACCSRGRCHDEPERRRLQEGWNPQECLV